MPLQQHRLPRAPYTATCRLAALPPATLPHLPTTPLLPRFAYAHARGLRHLHLLPADFLTRLHRLGPTTTTCLLRTYACIAFYRCPWFLPAYGRALLSAVYCYAGRFAACLPPTTPSAAFPPATYLATWFTLCLLYISCACLAVLTATAPCRRLPKTSFCCRGPHFLRFFTALVCYWQYAPACGTGLPFTPAHWPCFACLATRCRATWRGSCALAFILLPATTTLPAIYLYTYPFLPLQCRYLPLPCCEGPFPTLGPAPTFCFIL